MKKTHNVERTMFYDAPPETFVIARHLRNNLTKHEKLLRQRLCAIPIEGCRIKCQHPIGYYVTDFYCHAAKLVIALDGQHHSCPEQVFYDNLRTHDMQVHGIHVIRFLNDEVEYNIENVVTQIKNCISQRVVKRKILRCPPEI